MKKSLRSLSRMVIINFIFFFIVIYFLNKRAQLSKPLFVSPNNLPKSSVTQTNLTSAPSESTASVSVPSDSTPSDPAPTDLTQSDPTPTSAPSLLSQLSAHNSRSSCWFVIDGSLYDITSFFGSHPGGDETLIKYCGTDASVAFHTKDKMIPADHSASAKAMLQQYLIQ